MSVVFRSSPVKMLSLFSIVGCLCLCFATVANAAVVGRNLYNPVQTTATGDSIFEVGNQTYLGVLSHPKASVPAWLDSQTALATVIVTTATRITSDTIKAELAKYASEDDVWTTDFLEQVYISSNRTKAVLDQTAVHYLKSLGTQHLYTHNAFGFSYGRQPSISVIDIALAPGPYVVSSEGGRASFASVYRLYPDTYRDFLFGAYDSGEGTDTYVPLGAFLPKFWDPLIP